MVVDDPRQLGWRMFRFAETRGAPIVVRCWLAKLAQDIAEQRNKPEGAKPRILTRNFDGRVIEIEMPSEDEA